MPASERMTPDEMQRRFVDAGWQPERATLRRWLAAYQELDVLRDELQEARKANQIAGYQQRALRGDLADATQEAKEQRARAERLTVALEEILSTLRRAEVGRRAALPHWAGDSLTLAHRVLAAEPQPTGGTDDASE